MPARSDGRGLLTNGQMDESGNLTVSVQNGHAFFEPSHQEEATVRLEKFSVRQSQASTSTTQKASNDRVLDLVRSLTDLEDLCVTVETCHR